MFLTFAVVVALAVPFVSSCLDVPPVPNILGLVEALLFTHNTLISVLYSMAVTNGSRYIRGINIDGSVANKGAQFRNGVDSQYGDVVFVMKRDFWHNLRGVDYKTHQILSQPFIGHFYRRDFLEYNGSANVDFVGRWLAKEARMYTFRPPTSGLNGKECKRRAWNVSWCNLQLHIGQNVDFSFVEKVYVPAWLVTDTIAVQNISKHGINVTLLKLLVSNQLPFFPSEQQSVLVSEVNELNGRFSLYGPKFAADHYHKLERHHFKMRSNYLVSSIYSDIEPNETMSYTVQTHR
jgi:hypothetical protein